MTTLNLSATDAATLAVDAVVVGVAAGPKNAKKKSPTLVAAASGLKPAAVRRITEALVAVGATGKPGEVTKLPGAGLTKAPLLVAVGLGPAPEKGGDWSGEGLRRAAGSVVRALAGTRRVGLALPSGTLDELSDVATGALLGAYSFTSFRGSSAADQKEPVRTITLLVRDAKDKDAKAVAARAAVVADAVSLCRDLVNTPPGSLPPAALAQAAIDAAAGLDLTVEVLDEAALAAGAYGGIMAVGQGSANPPRLTRLAYRHPAATRHLALVGKGITFDSGGLSLKPPQSMETMKSDMGGAAAVIAAVTAIARLGLPVNVTGFAPSAENMPSGRAQRPGDVITMYGGTTVEVLNTDAEGRLILGDAIVRAAEEEPDLIVDVATLTGAQTIALGNRTAGIMGNDDDARDGVWESSDRAGESMWPMPLPEDLRASLDSEVADLKNIGDRFGGMLTAGLFLQEFVPDGRRWVHLDIAGPSFNEGKPYGYTPKGGTGAAVRTLIQVAQDLADGAFD